MFVIWAEWFIENRVKQTVFSKGYRWHWWIIRLKIFKPNFYRKFFVGSIRSLNTIIKVKIFIYEPIEINYLNVLDRNRNYIFLTLVCRSPAIFTLLKVDRHFLRKVTTLWRKIESVVFSSYLWWIRSTFEHTRHIYFFQCPFV